MSSRTAVLTCLKGNWLDFHPHPPPSMIQSPVCEEVDLVRTLLIQGRAARHGRKSRGTSSLNTGCVTAKNPTVNFSNHKSCSECQNLI